VAAVCAIAGSSYALVSTLPKPTQSDRIAVHVMNRLVHARGTGGTMHLAGATLRVRCRKVSPLRQLVLLSDGTRLLISGPRIRRLAGSRVARSLAAVATHPALTAAEGDLSGSYVLYATELTSQLNHGRRTFAGTTRFRGRRVDRLRLTRSHPDAELLVDPVTYRPLAVRFHADGLRGSTVLAPPTGVHGRAGC
jgi:hypothetical protein